MGAMRSWRQTIRKLLVVVGIIVACALVIALIVVIVLGYWLNWHWTGLVPETSEPQQHAKTLWDWLQLLAIPVVLGLGVAWFTAKLNEQQSRTEHEITLDNQRQAALQVYIDKISELLLHERLGESPPPDKVVSIAQGRTATVLRILDPIRRASLIQFLSNSGILAICVENSVKGSFDLPLNNENSLRGIELPGTNLNGVNLSMIHMEEVNLQQTSLKQANLQGADLSKANLRRADLSSANMQKAILIGADLQGARLFMADLRGANLIGANLERANLRDAEVTKEQLGKAKSLKGATMPDGKIHP